LTGAWPGQPAYQLTGRQGQTWFCLVPDTLVVGTKGLLEPGS